MTDDHLVFNPPPGWPKPPDGWVPPASWTPDHSWPDPPDGWQLWISADVDSGTTETIVANASELSSRLHSSEAAVRGEADAVARLALLEAENAALRAQLDKAGDNVDEFVILDDERILQSVGIYPLPPSSRERCRL